MTVFWNDAPIKAKARAAFRPAALAYHRMAQAAFPSPSVARSLRLSVSGNSAKVTTTDPRVLFFEKGVGRHIIEPKGGRVLRMADGRFVTGAVEHPGMRAQPTLGPLLRGFPNIARGFLRQALRF